MRGASNLHLCCPKPDPLQGQNSTQGCPYHRLRAWSGPPAARRHPRGRPRMLTVFVDADACPVKDEVYRVARRYCLRVAVVANAPLRVPAGPLVGLVVRPGFGAADDWIAE